MADALKAEGNKLFAEKDFEGSIAKFSQAIELDSSNHVLYSNRSGSYASLKKFDEALQDASKVTELKADWPKGWSRKGAALHGMGDLVAATEAYEEALKLDPNNAQAKSGLDSVARAIKAEASADGMGNDPFASMFQGNFKQKLEKDPRTKDFVNDPDFMAKLAVLQSNPNAMADIFQSGDPRLLQAMGVLLGIDMSFGAPPGGASERGGRATEAEEDVPMPDARSTSQSSKPAEPEPEPEPEDEEAIALKEAKAKADKEKELGTMNYMKRNFDEAIDHYTKAWEIHKDITYLTNLSAARFEKQDYQGAIEACQQAIDHGRTERADFKIMAKAFGRMGSSYEKLGDLTNAIKCYDDSLVQHRKSDILEKLNAAKRLQKKLETEAKIDPVKAEEARVEGNTQVDASNWPEAQKAYTRMIEHAPSDPRGYTNRALCYNKLLAFPSALEDCDRAIKLDPNFLRAYIRKAQAYLGMRQYYKCIDTCEEATALDKDGKNASDIQKHRWNALQALTKLREGETEEQTMARIQRDEDIQGIMNDPAMRSILEQANNNPASLQNHMRSNPKIRSNVEKLIAAGVIRTG